MQILTIINFAAAMQGFFLAYLLLNTKSDKEHRILSLLLLVMSIGLMGAVLGLSGYYKEFPHLIRIGDPLVFLYGPLLYFYIFSLTLGKLPEKYLLHLIPFAVYLVTLIPFYSLSGQEKITFGEKIFLNQIQPGILIAIQTLRTLHIAAYILYSLNLLKNFQKYLLDNFSDPVHLKMEKCNYLLKLNILFLFLGVGVYVSSLVFPINFVLTNNIIGLGLSVIIYGLAYITWNQTPVIVQKEDEKKLNENHRSTFNIEEENYASLSLKLKKVIEQDKAFLESTISLSSLSERIGLPPYLTSELISRTYNESFFDLINKNRIEEVKYRLQDSSFSHFSILGIAMDCGFNSKSSFNTAFKKFTGLTPSEYRKSISSENVRLSKDVRPI